MIVKTYVVTKYPHIFDSDGSMAFEIREDAEAVARMVMLGTKGESVEDYILELDTVVTSPAPGILDMLGGCDE